MVTVAYGLAVRSRKTMRRRARVVLTVLVACVGGLGLLVGFIVAWATVAYDLWNSTYGIAKKRLSRSTFDPADAPAVVDSKLARRMDDIVARNGGNLTVYSGFDPFTGSGINVGGWSFVVDLRHGKEDGETGRRRQPDPLEPVELYAAVERALREFDMNNLTIENRVFVNGADICDDRALLPSPIGQPTSRVNDADLRQLMTTSTHRVRHYMCIRVIDWRGELVLSLFVRFVVTNGRLFCELSRVLLTPIKPELHSVDRIPPRPELKDLLWLARRSLTSTLPLWLRSPAVVLPPVLRQWRWRAKLRKSVERDASFDYGTAINVLDTACSDDYSRYFQRLDHDMHVNALEHAILDTVVRVLDDHNIEVAEVADRTSTIINHGIMAGGAVNAENVAVGANAGIVQRFTPAQPVTDSSERKRNA